MQRLFMRLLEKDKRGYTAMESAKLGQGKRERPIERVDGYLMMRLHSVIDSNQQPHPEMLPARLPGAQ